jgi:phosphoserine phosphatase RsbU/P
MRIAILLLCTLASLHAQSIEVRSISQLAPLEGTWKVSAEDDPRFAAQDLDDSTWRAVRVPEEEISLPIGISWLRVKIKLPDTLRAEPLALLLPPLGNSYEVFVNGQPVGSLGNPQQTSGWGDLYTPVAAVFAVPDQSSEWTIAIRNRKVLPAIPVTPAARNAWVGTKPALAAKLQQTAVEVRWRSAGHLMVLAATAVAGLFFVVLPLWRQDAREFLWCGLYLLTTVILRPTNVAPWILEGLPVPLVLSQFFGILVLLLFSWEKLFRRLLGVRLSYWGQLCQRGGICVLGALFVLSPFLSSFIGPALAIFTLGMTSVIIAVYVDLARQSEPVDETNWMHLAVALLHGGNFVFFVLFGFVSVGPYVQNFALGVRAGGGLMFAAVMTMVLNRRSARLQQEQQRLAQEMRAGAEMQALLLPADSVQVPGFITEAKYLPMSEVGGDFHYALADEGSLVILVGDVSGKGLAAALLVAAVIGILRNTAERRPGAILAALNHALHGQTRGGFVTCCCARFDPDGTVTIASAGHLAPYADGAEIAIAGLPLGLVEDADYEEKSIQARSMTFLSDGVVEAENAQRELFGFDRTREIITQPAQAIAEAAKSWGQTDDITVVTVQRLHA